MEYDLDTEPYLLGTEAKQNILLMLCFDLTPDLEVGGFDPHKV